MFEGDPRLSHFNPNPNLSEIVLISAGALVVWCRWAWEHDIPCDPYKWVICLGASSHRKLKGKKNKKQVQTETNYSISMAHFTQCPQAASPALRAYLTGLGHAAVVENLDYGGNDLGWGFYAVDWNRFSGDGDHDWLMITLWKETREESCRREGRCEARKRWEGKKNKLGENISELARPLACVYCGA